jgi:oligopeptide/dipeptide ABC transporter ATP-binding protein
MTSPPLLAIEGLSVDLSGASVISELSLTIDRGAVVGLVGESGCGKTTLARAIMGLLPRGARVRGAVRFDGQDLAALSEEGRRRLRGDRISMVFQDSLAALDPMFPVGAQVAETVRAHRSVARRDARAQAVKLLSDVHIPSAHLRYRDPPHRFSGGMRQRAVIAAAIANAPQLLICDEPTTALDVTIQAQILLLLRDLQASRGTTILMITHDLGVVAQACETVAVMYAGQLVETGPVQAIFSAPKHPYTEALLGALPARRGADGLTPIPGEIPDLQEPPPGCRFAPRCPYRIPHRCDQRPELFGDTHQAACWLRAPDAAASSTAAGDERN